MNPQRPRLPPARSLLLRLLVALAVLAPLSPLPAQPPEQPRNLAGREAELAEIRHEISRLEERLEDVRHKEEGLSDQLAEVELELELQGRRVAEAEAARDLATEQVDAAETQVASLEEALANTREVLRERLAGLYRLGRQGYLRLLLSIEPGSDLLDAIRVLRFLVLRDAVVVDRYVTTRDRLEEERAALVARREEAESWAAQEAARRNQLVAVRRRHERLLEEVASERHSLASRTRLLEEKEQRLEVLIRSLSEGLSTGLEGRPIQEFKGVLDWPAPGDVAVGFGPRLDPRYGTRVPHNGIEIATRAGAPAKVVYPGKVVFSAPLEGYGPTVVVLHPGRVFTLYAGLESLGVAPEDVLSFGDPVGSVGESLYFEIRVDNRPQDPTQWLR